MRETLQRSGEQLRRKFVKSSGFLLVFDCHRQRPLAGLLEGERNGERLAGLQVAFQANQHHVQAAWLENRLAGRQRHVHLMGHLHIAVLHHGHMQFGGIGYIAGGREKRIGWAGVFDDKEDGAVAARQAGPRPGVFDLKFAAP